MFYIARLVTTSRFDCLFNTVFQGPLRTPYISYLHNHKLLRDSDANFLPKLCENISLEIGQTHLGTTSLLLLLLPTDRVSRIGNKSRRKTAQLCVPKCHTTKKKILNRVLDKQVISIYKERTIRALKIILE